MVEKLRKIKQYASREQMRKGKLYVKTYWNKPKEGEYVSVREFVAFCVSASGGNIYMFVAGFIGFNAGFFCGAIMGITVMDFYKIGIIGMVSGYAFTWMTPLNMLIYENFGRLDKKVRNTAHVAMAVKLTVGVAAYMMPSDMFESFLHGMPQIIGNTLVISVFNFYSDWFVRYKFGEKHGRAKPFVLIYSVPIYILLCVIPYINYDAFGYTGKVVLLHFLFGLLGTMTADYGSAIGMINFITPNSLERQKFFSIAPFFYSLPQSILHMLFPLMAAYTGGYTSLRTYRVFIPILCGVGMLMNLALIFVKERVLELKKEKRVKVTFLKGAKQVLMNKYLWILNISGLIGSWSGIAGNLLSLFFVYALRREWLLGFAGAVIVVPCNAAFFVSAYLIKRHERRNVYLSSRFCECMSMVGMAFAVYLNNLVLMLIFMGIRNFFGVVTDAAASGFAGEIMEYHQHRFGERCDSIRGISGWITGPIAQATGWILPLILALAGFTSDWDVFYDDGIRNTLLNIYMWGSVLGFVLGTSPFVFYDITKDKHKKIVEELKERLRLAEDDEQPPVEATLAEVTAGE